MSVYMKTDDVLVYHGDCIEVMRELGDGSVHAVVTDPPYGLEFMGREWDGSDGFRRSLNPADAGRDNVFGRSSRTSPEYRAGHLFEEWTSTWAAEALRVLKPGGHMLAFGGSRTWHRLAVGIEDAGFEMRDSIAWLYGSGFPKSLDVSKAIDKAAGAQRAVIGTAKGGAAMNVAGNNPRPWHQRQAERGGEYDVTAPATPEAERWQGWGTALKPAFEPIVVARKPLAGTVAESVLKHGTGALNIDATRVGEGTGEVRTVQYPDIRGGNYEQGKQAYAEREKVERVVVDQGRHPSNVVLDDVTADELDRQTGVLRSGANPNRRGSDQSRTTYGEFRGQAEVEPARGKDSGGASRFFPTFRYEAKAPTNERPRDGEVAHPTVKPLDLMRWLVRLVAPPVGIVLDPFAGSGTTLEAAVLEGFTCIGIEREAEYLPLIKKRLSKPLQQSLFGDWDGAA